MRSIAFFFLFAGLCACNGTQPQETAQHTITQDTVPVLILHTDTIKKTVELPAELIPYESAVLFAKVQGFVKVMRVDLGDRVKQGQVLAVIEAPEVNSRLAASEAAAQAAKAKWTSSRDNYERMYRASQAKTPGIVAPVDLERSRNQQRADSAAYEAASRESLSYKSISGYLYITAPFTGVITARNADPGALVGPNVMLLTVQHNQTLRLRAAIPEQYVAAASTSKEIGFTVDAYPTKRFKAQLSRKSETIDPATRTELWEFKVDNNDLQLKAGAFAYIRISFVRNDPSFIVPFTAVATTQEKRFIIKVKNGKAEWIDIRQGLTVDAGVEIFGNIAPGDTIIRKATDERKPGTTAIWKIQP